jgi:D-alanyl-D-alanine carboxypeptidase
MRSSSLRALLTVIGLGFAAAAVGSVGPAVAASHADSERLQRDVDAIHAAGVTGVQARLVTPDGREHVATSGVADLATGTPVPPTGHFRIASTGKTFVATVALQLVGEGRISLDDPVERWLPGVVRGNGNDGSRITVRHLLQHTSGIHDDTPDFASSADYHQHRYDVYTTEQLVARAMANPPDFAPGTAWMYSSTGYLLVDKIIERVTGRPWHEEVRDRILRPLGMEHTVWPGHGPSLPDPHAKGYQPFETDALVDVTEQVVADEGASVISTTRDVNRYFRALVGGELLRPAELAEMTRTIPVGPEIERIMPGARYGLGLFERPLPCGGTYWGHGGGGSGYITENGVTADGRRSVVVSMSSVLGHTEEHYVRQQRAADTLIGNALCGHG